VKKIGVMEYWSIGVMVRAETSFLPGTPILQGSNTPKMIFKA
jgi:hypothetical protein